MSDAYEKISKVEEISSKEEKATKANMLDRTSVKEGQFDEMLSKQQPQSNSIAVPIETTARVKQSLLDEVRDLHTKVEKAGKSSPDALADQARSLIAQIEEVKGKLSSSSGEIKGSVQNLLRNKLSHIDENLRIALDKAGVEYTNPSAPQKNLTNPIDRFLGFLTDGQYQLQNLAGQLDRMNATQKQMTPASLLSIQLKVGYIQQELELFTNLLNKALESTKTIMNVQV